MEREKIHQVKTIQILLKIPGIYKNTMCFYVNPNDFITDLLKYLKVPFNSVKVFCDGH